MKIIPLIKPRINAQKLKMAVDDIARTGILTKGKYLHAFEARLMKYLGVKHVFATTSCTTALHLGLVALGVKLGDEVLVADFSFPATGNVVVQVGAKPVLVDIDLDTYCIDIGDLERKITNKSKVIIVVHAFGYPADMTNIMRIARKHKLKVIEDAACAIGSKHKNKFCGTWGDIGCFSFHPRKVITTGEGGAIVTKSDAIAKRIEVLRNHGSIMKKDGSLSFVEAGFNYRMSELQAAMGIEQMSRIGHIIAQRRKITREYIKLLRKIGTVRLPHAPSDGATNFQSFVVLLPKSVDRDAIIKKLAGSGIETTLGTYALHAQPAFSLYGYHAGDLSNSFIAYHQTLTIPLYDGLTNIQITYIVSQLERAIYE